MANPNRLRGRTVHLYSIEDRSNVIGGLRLTPGITNANFHGMVEIILFFKGAYIIRNEGNDAIQRDNSPLEPGNYYIDSPHTFEVNNEIILVRTISSPQTGPRVRAFCNAVRARDRRCVVSKRENIALEVDEWHGFEAAHIFPLAYEEHWTTNNFQRWISVPATAGGSINSVQNGLLLDCTIHQLFDLYKFSINPDDHHKIIHFGFDGQGIAGQHLDQRFLDDPLRPPDALLRWHFRQAVLANMRGAGEPVLEHDFPPGSDIMDGILSGPMAAERMEAELFGRLAAQVDLGLDRPEAVGEQDTANTYSNGVSETIIGMALKKYSIPRSRVVILTKLYYPVLEGSDDRPQTAENEYELANQIGLSRKHIFDAVEGSLKRLQTDYIDVLQLHRLDHETEPEEIMRALHDLVCMGKVRCLGASSMRTWEFARLQYTARLKGWTEFVSMQGLYNLLYREEEREMNPFCNAEGVGLIPWSPLARGLLCRPVAVVSERSERDDKSKKWFRGSMDREIIGRVERVAKRKNCSMTVVATASLLTKGCAPILGLGSEKRIEEAVDSFDIKLTDEDLLELEELYESVSVVAM